MARDAERVARLAAQRGQDAMAAKLVRIAQQAASTRSTGFRAPELDADPASDDPTNIWALADGRLRMRTLDGTIHEFTPDGAAPSGGTDTTGGSTSTKPKPSDPTPKKYVRTYAATWARTFCATHGVETGGQLYYGTYPGSAHGMRKVMVGFDDTAIRADLAGSTIRGVDLTMLNTHSWPNSGVEVHFGAHNRSAVPAGFSAVRKNAWSGHWPKVGKGKDWRGVPDWYGRHLRDGNIRGLTIDQPSASAAYYGQMDWSTIRLRIAFTR